jgi:uncharacterized protein (UPF0218 family)
MIYSYGLPPELRQRLKQPIGTLIKGSLFETTKRLKEIVENEELPYIISVGDTVSRNLVENQIRPRLAIVDNVCMRRTVEEPAKLKMDKTVHVKNPQATITAEAIHAIQDALKGNASMKIVVDGEEDLLTLVAVLYAPENSFVVYGQPYEGIVVVKVTPEKKAEIARLLKEMEIVRKAK